MTKNILRFCVLLILAHAWGKSTAISRRAVIARAKSWLYPVVPFSFTAYKDGYTTQCSGYVSMAWKTGKNYNTMTLPRISTAINKDELKRGDILLKPGTHVIIFEKWADASKTKYWGLEQLGGSLTEPTKYWQIPYPYFGNDQGYLPRRYKYITD